MSRAFPIALTACRLAAALVAFVATSKAQAAITPEQVCQQGRYAAASKYYSCEEKLLSKFFAGRGLDPEPLSKCRVKYASAWIKLQTKTTGSGATCDAARFADNGDGTVTDRLTGLQWEEKTTDATVHDVGNTYTWTAGTTGADGTAYTSLLATLNGGSCFAGDCDWRLPTRAELQTIMEAYPCATTPCIDPVFGPTVADFYWSSTTYPIDSGYAFDVSFALGGPSDATKNFLYPARAVRGGL